MSDSITKTKEIAVFTFGRFQPPTIGHQVLIEGIKTLATERNGDAYVFVSSTVNNMEKYLTSSSYAAFKKSGEFESTADNENPLAVEQKVGYLKKMYPSDISIINTTTCGCTNLTAIVDKLEEAGYISIVIGVGSDRVGQFQRIFSKHGNIEVVGVGAKRKAKNKTTAGMSGTKMRLAAVRGDLDLFKTGVMIGSMTESNVQQLMKNVRIGLGVEERVVNSGATGRESVNSGAGKKENTTNGGRRTLTRKRRPTSSQGLVYKY